MLKKIINFTLSLTTSSLLIFIIFDWLIMPTYIRKGNSVVVMNLQGKDVKRALKQLESEGFKAEIFDTLYTSKFDPETIIDDNYGSPADTIINFDNNPDWGSIILVDVGRLDKDELNIDTDATVGGLG